MDQPTSPGRRSRGFSMRSDRSAGSKGRVDHLTESPEEKARRDSIYKPNSKANPNAAMNEAQPGGITGANVDLNTVLNLTEASTLTSLREGQHKDVNGNVIVDPDLSNPTRPRLERPLDTIRSFEKAIDNGYKRRSSYRAESSDQSNNFGSRRSSYLNGEYTGPTKIRRSLANNSSTGMDSGPSPGRQSANAGGYYGGQRPGSYLEGQNGPPRQRYGNRMMSDGAMYQQNRPYQPHGPHQSQDTMHTGVSNGSDSTGPWASGTDPSSENSSIDRNMANGKQPENYGQSGFGPPIMEEQGAGAYGSNGYGSHGGPNGGPVQAPPGPRKPIALGNSGGAPAQGGSLPTPSRPEKEDKKKGWLKRRFSKNE
ncbi:hypothetical protein LTR08_005308 [Meristemomyces frigidus]|nr:hypothetical protein LTR08_005308 [Meristemomyces frigidus]